MPRLSDSELESYMIEFLEEDGIFFVPASYFRRMLKNRYGIDYRDDRYFNKRCEIIARKSSLVGHYFAANAYIYYLLPVIELGKKMYPEWKKTVINNTSFLFE